MTRSQLEVARRHPLLLVAPLLLALVLGAGYALLQPRDLEARATVWADSALYTDSTIGTTGGENVPSAGQSALLGQLLASRSFLVAIAERTPLRDELRAASPDAADRLLTLLAAAVTRETTGPQLLVVTITWDDASLAVDLARATVDQLLRQEQDSLRARAQVQVATDQELRDDASQALNTAQEGIRSHLDGLLGAAPGTGDVRYAALLNDAALAQQQYADAQRALVRDSTNLADVADVNVLRIQDVPQRAHPQSRRAVLALGAAGGLLAGGTVSVLLFLLLLARAGELRPARPEAIGTPVTVPAQAESVRAH